MTPAASKNNVYFMWDFVGRTLVSSPPASLYVSALQEERGSLIRCSFLQGMLYNVDPTLQDLSEEENEKWNDARGRSVYAGMLITDQMKGALDMMTESTYPGQKGKHPEFGEEILKLAREMCGVGGESGKEKKGEKKKKGGKKGKKKVAA